MFLRVKMSSLNKSAAGLTGENLGDGDDGGHCFEEKRDSRREVLVTGWCLGSVHPFINLARGTGERIGTGP